MPRPRKNTDLLAAFIDRLADAVVAHLGGSAPATRTRTRKKPSFSRAGIERIRAAQKKRWAAYRRAKASK
jgi:hypothetical protein